MSQPNTFGYGVPTIGQLVVGGENARDFPLIGVNYSESYPTDFATVAFRVIARGATNAAKSADMQTKLAALDDLAQHSGNLCWGGDAEDTITATIAVAGKSITLTRTAGTRDFTLDDVGRIVNIVGVGSFQIGSFASATVVGILANSQLDAPASASGLTVGIAVPLRVVRESDKKIGMQARVKITPLSAPRDHKFRRTFSMQVVIEKPAKSATDDGRRRASISVITNSGTDLRTVIFRGQYTALNTGVGTSNNAITTYEANSLAWSASFITSLAGTFEKRQDTYDVHDELNVLVFTQVYQEKNFNDTAAALNDTTITNAQVKMVRRSRNIIGNPLYEAPTYLQIAYSAQIKKSVTHDGILGKYEDAIKRHILSEARSKFSGTNTVIMDEFVTIDPENMIVTAFLDVYMRRGKSPNVLAFKKTVSWNLNTRNDIRQRWDGIPHSYVVFTPGPQIVAVSTVQTRLVGGAAYQGSTRFRIGPKGLVFIGRTGGDENTTDTDEFQVPGDPPFTNISQGGEGWLLLEAEVAVTPFARGLDVERIGATDIITDALYSAVWLWCRVEGDAPLNDNLSDPSEAEIDGGTGDREPTTNPSVGQNAPPSIGGGDFDGIAGQAAGAISQALGGLFSSSAPPPPSIGQTPQLF